LVFEAEADEDPAEEAAADEEVPAMAADAEAEVVDAAAEAELVAETATDEESLAWAKAAWAKTSAEIMPVVFILDRVRKVDARGV